MLIIIPLFWSVLQYLKELLVTNFKHSRNQNKEKMNIITEDKSRVRLHQCLDQIEIEEEFHSFTNMSMFDQKGHFQIITDTKDSTNIVQMII